MLEATELSNGDFLFVGKSAVQALKEGLVLPHPVSVHDGEEAVIVSRKYILEIAREILRNEDIN